jgi:hypothetical protein
MNVGCGPLALLLAAIVVIGGLFVTMPVEVSDGGTAGPVIEVEVSPSP